LCLLLGTLLAVPAARAAGFDFAALEALLKRRNIGSVEELLPALPVALRSRYALVFDSRSLQAASPENPRVILYGADARFILTFNGSPQQHGFHSVETMEFDDRTGVFHLRELVFPEQASAAAPVAISDVNPERCRRCHGAPAHPVWDTFPLWPGAYGERYRVSLSAGERRGLAAFLAQQTVHPRYRYLLDAGRFADPQTFRASALYAGIPQEPPNAELAIYLAQLQFQAIAQEVLRQPAFGSYQYALLGVADSGCGRLADFYPDELWRSEQPAFERFARDTAAANARQSQLKHARTSAAGATYDAVGVNALLELRFVAEAGLGINTAGWTLALEKGSYDFTAPASPAPALRSALLEAVARADPAVRALSFSATPADGDRYCSYLRRRSRSALTRPGTPTTVVASELAFPAGPAAASVAVEALRRPVALQLCVNCHETGIAPLLPFSDPGELSQLLRVRQTPHGALLDEIRFRLSPQAGAHRMPLGVTLSDSDWRGLEAYFVTLADHRD
jgi:hypothetical protein